MPSSLDLTRDWLKTVLRAYPSREILQTEVLRVLQRLPSLAVKTDAFTFDSGATALLLLLHGTLPITYRGASYHIPVHIWFPHEYPRAPPLVFVVPTKDMGVRKGPEVEPGGKVRDEVMAAFWGTPSNRNLDAVIGWLTEVFSAVPPVYAKPPEQRQQPQRSASTSSNSGAARPAAANGEVLPGYHSPPPNVNVNIPAYAPGSRQSSISYPQSTSPAVPHTPPPAPQSPPVPLRPGQQPPVPSRPVIPPPIPVGVPAQPQPLSPAGTGSTGWGGQQQQPYGQQQGYYQQPYPQQPQPQHQPQPQPQSPQIQSQQRYSPQRQGSYPPQGPPQQQLSHQQPQAPQPPQPPHPPQVHQPPQPPVPPHPPQVPPHPQQPYPPQFQGYQPPSHQYAPGPPQAGQAWPPTSGTPPAPGAAAPAAQPTLAPPTRTVDLLSSPDTTATELNDAPPPLPRNKPPPPSLVHLHTILLPHLQSSLPPIMQNLADTKSHLVERREDLASGEPAIRDEMARLEAVKKVCDAVGGRLNEVVTKGSERVAELEARGDVSVDEVVCSISIVHNQLIDLVAEDNAISDTIYHVTRALDAERIDLNQYLKAVRSLAREQYMKRALIERINEGMGGSAWSVS